MYLSTPRLYHPALWKMFFSYKVALVTLRTIENIIRLQIYVFVQGPSLVAWTRLPGLRGRKPPIWASIAYVVAPIQSRASLNVGGGQVGSNFALAGSVQEMDNIQSSIVGAATPPAGIWSVLGAFMRGYFSTMGPAFIKFGQILSMREELPPVIRAELALLQDKLPPMPYKQIRKLLERELDRPLEEVFEWVEEKPIASGSLAQVHRAKLRREREEVALKIQRPHLHGIVALDTIYLCDIVIGIIKRLLPTLSKGADFGVFTTSYREQLSREIDFITEERTQVRFRKLIENHPIYSQATKVAKTYREYTTTKLLTMEYVNNLHRLDRIMDDLTPQQLLAFATTRLEGLPPELPLHLVWVQMAIQLEGLSHWGLSHGDVHLGNLYALEPKNEGDPWRMFLCDFGMMIDANEGFRIMACECGMGFTYYCDGSVLGRAFSKQSVTPVPPKNHDKLVVSMAQTVDKYFIETREGAERVWYPKIQRGTSTTIISELVYGTATLGLHMAPENWLLLKNFGYLCNMATAMWTSFSPLMMWLPHARKYVKDVVLHDLDRSNITNMSASLPQLLSIVREYDRSQMVQSLETGHPVIPLRLNWGDDWDVRAVENQQVSKI
jgi:predicted unusual protein kinase regulating ubiquinone biosynthesis (AarF/ABC1/UbiB family)